MVLLTSGWLYGGAWWFRTFQNTRWHSFGSCWVFTEIWAIFWWGTEKAKGYFVLKASWYLFIVQKKKEIVFGRPKHLKIKQSMVVTNWQSFSHNKQESHKIMEQIYKGSRHEWAKMKQVSHFLFQEIMLS